MVIYRSSDTLSRCDPGAYSNIYDVKKHPGIKLEANAEMKSGRKDTIEISRDKLNEEALSRLRHTTKYFVAQSSFMRIGKYLFLALAFPPYFAVYGLPKWIVTEGLPALFSMSVWVWKIIKTRSKPPLDASVRKLGQMTQFIQNLTLMMIRPFVFLSSEIRQKFQRMQHNVSQFFSRAGKKLGRMRERFERFKPGHVGKAIRRGLPKIKEALSRRIQGAKVRLQQKIQSIQEKPLLFLGWGQAQIQSFKEKTLSLVNPWKKSIALSKESADRSTEWVLKQCARGMAHVKKSFRPFAQFYLKSVAPRWQKFCEAGKKQGKGILDFFEKGHRRSLAFLMNSQEKLKGFSSVRFLDALISHPLMGKLPAFLQKWIKRCLSSLAAQKICAGAIKGYSFFIHGLQITTQGFRMAGWGCAAIVKTGSWIAASLKAIGKEAHRLFAIFVDSMGAVLKFALYYFLLFWTIAFILFVWGVRFLSRYMQSFASLLARS